MVDGEESTEGRDPLAPDSGGGAVGLAAVTRKIRAMEERLLDIMGSLGRRSQWSYWRARDKTKGAWRHVSRGSVRRRGVIPIGCSTTHGSVTGMAIGLDGGSCGGA
jgi:hypothetical protein